MSWFKPAKLFTELNFNAPIISVSNTAKSSLLRIWKNENYKTYLLKIFNRYDKKGLSIVLSKEHILSITGVLLKSLLGEVVMSSLKSKTDVILEYFFKATRTKHGKKFIHRAVILRILERGTAFASEIMREQNVSFPNALRVMHEMERDGIIIRKKGVGRMVPYSFSIEPKQIKSLVLSIEGLRGLY